MTNHAGAHKAMSTESVLERANISVYTRDCMQKQVLRDPGRLAVSAMSLQFSVGRRVPKERWWGIYVSGTGKIT